MNMIRKIIILCAAAAMLIPPLVAIARQIDYGRSQITFTSKQMNVPVEAKFNKFTAQLTFNSDKPESSKAAIEVDVGSFDIRNDEVNSDVLRKEWFDSKSFPKATFVSSGVRALGNGRYEARGPLTIKGKTHEITVPFTVNTDASGNALFEGVFNIRRLQYNIGEGVWKHTDVVADEVQIKFKLHASRNPPPKK
jgi:polyisoprenoid-binding protein YceI